MTRRRERIARIAVAAGLAVVASGVLTALALGTTASRTPVLMTVLEDTVLHRLGIPAVAAELDDSDVVAHLRTGPLELTHDDILEILRRRFSPEDVALKAREVHRGLVEYVRSHPRDSVFRIEIVRERPLLVRAAEARILRRYRSLPDCGAATDLEVLGRAGAWKLFGDGSGAEFLESLPRCFPPEAVANPVIEGIRAEMGRMLLAGADSVVAFPEPATVDWPTYSRLVRRIQRVDRLLSARSGAFLAGILVLLAAVAVGGRRYPVLPGGWLLAVALGVALAGSGLLLRLDGLSESILTAFGGEPGSGSRAQRLWLDLGAYGIRRVLLGVSGALLAVGSVLGLAGALGLVAADPGDPAGAPPGAETGSRPASPGAATFPPAGGSED